MLACHLNRQPQAESFTKTLKCKEIYALDYGTLNEIKYLLPRFIDEACNWRRIHWAPGHARPVKLEEQFA